MGRIEMFHKEGEGFEQKSHSLKKNMYIWKTEAGIEIFHAHSHNSEGWARPGAGTLGLHMRGKALRSSSALFPGVSERNWTGSGIAGILASTLI